MLYRRGIWTDNLLIIHIKNLAEVLKAFCQCISITNRLKETDEEIKSKFL